MANNVYIGSRYVPKFDGDYDNTKSYEPLTIVNYGGSSYTSKRQVPAGTLPTDSNYWAESGNYNGMISALDARVTAAENAITNLQNYGDLTEIFVNKHFAVFGDSISSGDSGIGFTPWVNMFSDFVSQFGSDVVNYAVGGDTIALCNTRVTAVQSQLNNYDSIVLFIGTNDVNNDWASVQTAVKALATTFANNFNGKLFVVTPVHAGSTREEGIYLVGLSMIADCLAVNFKATCHNAIIVDGFGFGAFELADTVHPTTAGSRQIYLSILQTICGRNEQYDSHNVFYKNISITADDVTFYNAQIVPISETALLFSANGTFTATGTSAFKNATIGNGKELLSNPYKGPNIPIDLVETGNNPTSATAHLYYNGTDAYFIYGGTTASQTYDFNINYVLEYNSAF